MSAADGKQYCLKWNNFSDNILTSLESLRGDEDFVDVTIACEGHSLKAHKVVLSACSAYIKKLLKENPCAHPIIILKDVALSELQALLSFMYNGQVMVEEEQIPRLLRTAEVLEIRGLADLTALKEPVEKAEEKSAATENEGPPSKRTCPDVGWGAESEEDEEYEDDEDEEEEEEAALPDFPLSDVSKSRDLQVTTHFARPQQPKPDTSAHTLHPAHQGEMQEAPPPSRAMMPPQGQRAVDIAARVSQMEDSLLPGDVLVIGETHITPARCVPRPLKPPPPDKQQQQCYGGTEASDSRLSLEMSLRLQVQRKLEAERLRAMERLRHAEAVFNESVMNNTPMDCSPFPVLTNGVHPVENGHAHREDAGLMTAQPPPAPPPPPPGPPTIPLPLSPDLQLKMLMCRDFKKYTNMLLVAVFGREVLATHCLNGSKGSAKPRLDTDKVTRVIATVMEKFDVPASTVREAIRVKLNNEDKLKKRSKRSANPLL